MYYLVDTNVYIHVINDCMYSVAKKCCDKDCKITITETILSELEPGTDKVEEDPSLRDVFVNVENLVTGKMGTKLIRLISVADVPGAKEKYKSIRSRYYSWMKEPQYLKKLVDEGKISKEDIGKTSFRNKDKGECELIAIALAALGQYAIVSEDVGRVFLHPWINIFDLCARTEGVTVQSGGEWLKTIGE